MDRHWLDSKGSSGGSGAWRQAVLSWGKITDSLCEMTCEEPRQMYTWDGSYRSDPSEQRCLTVEGGGEKAELRCA